MRNRDTALFLLDSRVAELLSSPITLLDYHGREVGTLQAGMEISLVPHSMILCHQVEEDE